MVRALAGAGLTVVVCCAVIDLDGPIDLDGLDSAAWVVKRRNGGYDFAAWAAILDAMPELWSAKRLFFVNDSILGPLTGFDKVIERIRTSSADFVALTESHQIRHHSQTYFFVLQNRGLLSGDLRSFWRKVRVEKTKMAVIQQYEVSLLSHVRDVAALKAEVLFSYDSLFPGIDWTPLKPLNPTHHLWEHLVNAGFPFVKAELLHTNPLDINIAHWQQIVALRGGDVGTLRAHLDKMTQTRGAPRWRRRINNWHLLRRVIGDQTFVELCNLWAVIRYPRR